MHSEKCTLPDHLTLSHYLIVCLLCLRWYKWIIVNQDHSTKWTVHQEQRCKAQCKVNSSPRTEVQITVRSELFTKNRGAQHSAKWTVHQEQGCKAHCRCTSPQPPDSKPLTFSANFTQISLHQILLLLVMFFCNQLFWPTFLTSSTHFIKYTNTLSRNHFYEHEFFFSELLTFWRNWNNLHLQFSFDSCCLTTFQLVLSCWL